MSSPVQMWKAFTPWWSSMYIPLKVGHPASRASLRSLVSLGSYTTSATVSYGWNRALSGITVPVTSGTIPTEVALMRRLLSSSASFSAV